MFSREIIGIAESFYLILPKAYSEPSQTFDTEHFPKIPKTQKLLPEENIAEVHYLSQAMGDISCVESYL